MENIIEISALHKRFGDVAAVNNISFCVEANSLFAFLGQNGAGKSTTINMLLGLLKPDKGHIDYGAFGGYDAFKKSIGVVFQNNVFDDLLSVKENLLLYGQLYLQDAKAVKRRYGEICELLDLGGYAEKRFRTLSGGQKRKAEIARALFNAPRLLFLDEPTTGLDPKTRIEVWTTLREIQRDSGMAIFLTTHYMEETADADKVIIIHKGEHVCEGSPAELKAQYSHDRLLITANDDAKMESSLAELRFAFEKKADTYAIKVQSTAESIQLLHMVKDNVRYYEAIKGSMDDVFLSAVGEEMGGGK